MPDTPTPNVGTSQSGGGQNTREDRNDTTKAPMAANENDRKNGKTLKLEQLWAKADLDVPTFLMMIKGSLAPTIAIAMFQAPAVANHYGGTGYLIAIMAVLGFPIMPRGMYIRSLVLNVLAVCVGAATNLLALYTATRARINTAAPGAAPTAYNSSASAVCGIWLFVQMYLANYLRVARPPFKFPVIIYSIFAIASMVYGPLLPTMASCTSFMQQLLEGFLTGFGLAAGVHFLFVPVSSRTVVFKKMSGYLGCLGGTLKAQTAYMQSLESIDPVALHEKQAEERDPTSSKKEDNRRGPLDTPESDAEKDIFLKLLGLHTKLDGDVTASKREFALGKLESKDITQMWKQLRSIFIPVLGLASSIDILRRRAEQRHWDSADLSSREAETNKAEIESLHATTKALHGPFVTMTEQMVSGFQHIQLTLELIKAPKKKVNDDEEDGGDYAAPGSAAFADHLRSKLDEFRASRHVTLEHWCLEKGLPIPTNGLDGLDDGGKVPGVFKRQLFFILYMEYLLLRSGQATLNMVLFADNIKQEGKLNRAKLIFPGSMTLYKWLKATISREDIPKGDQYWPDTEASASDTVNLGAEYDKKPDPERAPPRNSFERFGTYILLVPKFFQHRGSAFGFRVACATLSLGVIDYLHDTQSFFIKGRLLWSLIMIPFAMQRLSGQSTFQFLMRAAGTTIAMIASYVIWYIVDGHVAGVIVFLWLWITCAYWIVFKMPQYVTVGILSIVTPVLIVGYELQVQVLGIERAEASGQPAYPIYIFAPYRLAAVLAGLFVAWIWTIWPYPVSETSELRKDLGASMYMLAKFSAVTHEIVQNHFRGTGGDINTRGTHVNYLEKTRVAIFAKLLLLLNEMRTNSAFSRFTLSLGGQFPRETYESIIERVQRIAIYTVLIAYASQTLSLDDVPEDGKTAWSNDFRRLVSSVNVTSNQITSLLSLLSSSLANSQLLPPFLEPPQPYEFVKKLESIDRNILSVRHIEEPGYSAFAVVEICGSCVSDEVGNLAKDVKTLVGEVDFSFRIGSAGDSGSNVSSNQLPKGKAE